MSIQQLQQHLIEQISTVNDKNILMMLEEELSYYLKHKEDLSGVLSEEDYNELAMLAKEPPDKDTISLDEFNNMLEKWRTK